MGGVSSQTEGGNMVPVSQREKKNWTCIVDTGWNLTWTIFFWFFYHIEVYKLGPEPEETQNCTTGTWTTPVQRPQTHAEPQNAVKLKPNFESYPR